MAKKRAIPQHVRRAIATRYGCTPGCTIRAKCHYCSEEGQIVWHRLADGQPSAWVSFPGLHLDHVIPEAAGGPTDDPDNFVLACRTCNSSKGHRFTEPLQTGSQKHSGEIREPLQSHSRGEGKGRERKGRGTLTRHPKSVVAVERPAAKLAVEQAASTSETAQVQTPTRARESR